MNTFISPRYNTLMLMNSSDNPNLFSYAAFLRGINISGKRQIKMEALRDAFQSWGFEKVLTILASGNILFDASVDNPKIIRETITNGIRTSFGFNVGVFIRTIAELKAMADRDPFKGYTESAQLKLYVTFVNQKPEPHFSIPYQSLDKELAIILLTGFEIYSAVHLTPRYGTTDMMAFMEKEFGGELTTRNWNTVVKILDLNKKNNLKYP